MYKLDVVYCVNDMCKHADKDALGSQDRVGHVCYLYELTVQAYIRPAVAAPPADASTTTRVLPGDSNEVYMASQQPGSNSEFAQRLASRYNPRYSRPNTSSDQRAADVF